MNQRAFVVMNPAAGKGDGVSVREQIEDALDKAQWAYDVHETSENEDLASLVKQKLPEGPDVVIASGGDGTVCWAAGGLVNSDIPLGLVPSGTANGLARELGIPINTRKAMALITGPHVLRVVDALYARDRYFLLNVSVGLAAKVMQDSSREDKNRFGFLAYIVTFVRTIIGLQPARFKVRIDGGATHRVRASDVIIANSGAVGLSSLQIAPDISLDDGEIAVCFIRARSAIDYLIAALNIVFDVPERSQRIRCMTAKKSVSVEPNRTVPVQGDGELLGRGALTVDIVHRAVSIITPENDNEAE